MKPTSILTINLKKLRFRFKKALFLILPITILVTLSIVITSQVHNFRQAMEKYIFKEIDDEATILEVQYQAEEANFKNFQAFAQQTQYSENDISAIQAIEGVSDASLNYTVPISNISTSTLFDNTKFYLNNLTALNENLAGMYTSESFDYAEGEPIPIVLNANSFIETYQDWGGKTEIEMDFQPGQRPATGTNPMESSPIKTRAISYSKEGLIGKEFTITFGGFKDVNNYTIEREDGTNTFKKLTDAEVATLETERKDTIDDYWKYDELEKGISYTFKVVGLIEDESNRASYIPEAFSKKVMSDYVNYQLSNRTSTSISDSLLNSTFTGLLYDGTELKSTNQLGGKLMMRFGGGPEIGKNVVIQSDNNADQDSYEIPGLVIRVSEDDANDIEGIETTTTDFSDVAKTGDTILIKIDSVLDRGEVVEALNDSGYAYQDVNDLEIFDSVESTLNQVSVGVVIAFIVLTAGVIVLTMSKFVSESRKEIGIFRAVGFTRRNILSIYLFQSILYTAVGFGVGVGFGLVLNLAASGLVSAWFNRLVTDTVAESYNVISKVDTSVFTHVDFGTLGILAGILLLITFIISIIPALNASNTSPVEAIKSE